MKRYLLIIAFISLMIGMNAQEHLSFKGIPIDGSLSQFVNKLEQEGYALVYTNDEGDACVLRGTFAGYSNCNVYVISTEKSHIVWDVTVMLPEQRSWYSLKSRYNEYKNSLTQKYGTPSDDFHYFSSPYYEGDGYELQALNNDKCTYSAEYQLENGNIEIAIKSKNYNSGRVSISYQDKINNELRMNEQQEDKMNDL